MTALARLLSLFWNREERRLRAGWRLLLAAALFLLLLVGASLALAAVVGDPATVLDPLAAPFVAVTLQGTVAVVAVLLAALALDRRRLADYGFRRSRDWWLDFGFGLALGAVLMTGVFLLELAAGWVRVVDVFAASGEFLPAFALGLYLFAWVGLYEELLVRGYLLTNLAEGLRAVAGRAVAVGVATLASSAIFGVLHGLNPNATAVSVVSVGLAGIVLALGYVLTGDLAIPVGLHVTWNTFQGLVYGFPVSGIRIETSVVATVQRGPRVATGGAFGPEAGLVGVAALLVGAGAIVAWCRYRYGDLSVAAVDVPDLRWR